MSHSIYCEALLFHKTILLRICYEFATKLQPFQYKCFWEPAKPNISKGSWIDQSGHLEGRNLILNMLLRICYEFATNHDGFHFWIRKVSDGLGKSWNWRTALRSGTVCRFIIWGVIGADMFATNLLRICYETATLSKIKLIYKKTRGGGDGTSHIYNPQV